MTWPLTWNDLGMCFCLVVLILVVEWSKRNRKP